MDNLINGLPSLGTIAEIRQVIADDMSDLRHVHETSVRLLARDMMTPEDVDEWSRFVRSPAYTDKLFSNPNLGVWLDGQMIAAASWQPSTDQQDTAKITALFVRPMFALSGVGARLLEIVEAETAAAGFQSLTIRSFQSATGFFQSKGYRISSYGIRVISPRLSFPVTFMRKGVSAPKKSMARFNSTETAS
ncbi:MAG: GNAT family N-acetyltransferase [Pseudomonadota bacterium]